jgi:hypothetical protein
LCFRKAAARSAEVDGGYFGGYVKPANRKEHRLDRRLAENQSGKRKVVLIIKSTLVTVFTSAHKR